MSESWIAKMRRHLQMAGPPGRDPSSPDTGKLHLKKRYERCVDLWKEQAPPGEAMEMAIGGEFELIGRIEADILLRYGLRPEHYLIDVGCGSGRLAEQLSAYLTGRYFGFDLVRDLVEHARRIANRSDWRFETIDHIGIAEQDGAADMVCFFSVLTHLLHEQSYWYLEEARRVLKPGGRIVFSFIEFREPLHWTIFRTTLADAKANANHPPNVFIERSVIPVWAEHLGLKV
jgi:2-polyprenyl-3-methyl-5-hydroxy-6-metoxy-1,4-benzoquinol methylase